MTGRRVSARVGRLLFSPWRLFSSPAKRGEGSQLTMSARVEEKMWLPVARVPIGFADPGDGTPHCYSPASGVRFIR